METGSLVNLLYAGMTNQPVPEIGMGATVLAWTDRYAGTIIDIGLDGSITVQIDKWARTDKLGMTDSGQSYVFERDPDGATYVFNPVRRGKAKGQLREGGRKDGYAVLVGRREKYHDFSF